MGSRAVANKKKLAGSPLTTKGGRGVINKMKGHVVVNKGTRAVTNKMKGHAIINKKSKPGDLYNKYKKKSGLRPADAVVRSEQNASHQMYKKSKKKMC